MREAYYRDLLGRFQWLEVALCVTYVRGLGEDDVIRAFRGDPASTETRAVREHEPGGALFTTAGDHVVVLEPNGRHGIQREVLRPCSARGEAMSVYWNVDGDERLLHCVQGRTTRDEDPAPPAGLLAIAEESTGVRLDDALLDGRRPRGGRPAASACIKVDGRGCGRLASLLPPL